MGAFIPPGLAGTQGPRFEHVFLKEKTHGCRLCDEKWHLLEESDVYEELQSGPQGLDDAEAARRLTFYGPNTLPAKEMPTAWQILLHQVLNPLIFILLVAAAASLVIGALAFGDYYWLIELRLMEENLARDSVLLLMVLLQNVHVFNCRSESTSAFRVPLNRNYVLIFGVAAAQAIHIASMHLPFMQAILGTSPVLFSEWLTALLLALVVLVVMEIFKFIASRGNR
jgi:magnesium-transporting ATPase (P-type)